MVIFLIFVKNAGAILSFNKKNLILWRLFNKLIKLYY